MTRVKDLGFKSANFVHRSIYRLSRGRLLGKGKGMPMFELETIGRRSGKARTAMLAAPIHSEDRLVIVASKAGDDRHPAWFLNLRDNPSVRVTMNGISRQMTARVVGADEKAQLWSEIVRANKSYEAYQAKTDRDIPVVVLDA